MRLGEVAADEAAATVSVKCRTANDRVSRKIETWSVIVATRTCPLDASFRSMLKRTPVHTVVHDVETEIDKLQLI